MERVLAPATARILCVCDDEREEGLRIGIKADRMRVIHNGSKVMPAGTEPSQELEEFRGTDGVLIGSVAVLREQQKRIDVLIDAAPSILAADERARIAIIGNGPLNEELRDRATQLGLKGEPRFAFFPFVPPAFPQLAALDVYVLPSSWEAFPIGVLEAMACGTPQVATDVGGTREAVVDGYGRAARRSDPDRPAGTIEDETGLLVPPADPQALSRAILELVRDPARRQRMADASRARHAEHFTLGVMADRIAAAYREVLGACAVSRAGARAASAERPNGASGGPRARRDADQRSGAGAPGRPAGGARWPCRHPRTDRVRPSHDGRCRPTAARSRRRRRR